MIHLKIITHTRDLIHTCINVLNKRTSMLRNTHTNPLLSSIKRLLHVHLKGNDGDTKRIKIKARTTIAATNKTTAQKDPPPPPPPPPPLEKEKHKNKKRETSVTL